MMNDENDGAGEGGSGRASRATHWTRRAARRTIRRARGIGAATLRVHDECAPAVIETLGILSMVDVLEVAMMYLVGRDASPAVVFAVKLVVLAIAIPLAWRYVDIMGRRSAGPHDAYRAERDRLLDERDALLVELARAHVTLAWRRRGGPGGEA